MEKIKRFITCLVPVHACNFRCSYCYLSHKKNSDAYGGGIRPLCMDTKSIAHRLSRKRLGGVCYFNLCAAGETMMHPEIINLTRQLLGEGHYVDLVTNGTLSARFDELIEKLSNIQKKHLFIKFSFHYLELQKRNMMEKFLDNVKKIKQAEISYTIEVTPHDELVPYIEELKEFSIEHFGAWPHITVARNEGTKNIGLLTNYSKEEYKKIWSVFHSDLFDFKLSLFNQKRGEFCYAGVWSLTVDLETGYYRQCYMGDILGNICDEKSINFRAIGKCREPHCFNGHAFLALGNIPEINTVNYSMERNRVMENNEQWLGTEVNAFFSTKLSESNRIYSKSERNKILLKNGILSPMNKLFRFVLLIRNR